jgi:hypothetical protein
MTFESLQWKAQKKYSATIGSKGWMKMGHQGSFCGTKGDAPIHPMSVWEQSSAPTFAALTALTFSSRSTNATLTFSELSWRLYLSASKSCSNNGWLNLLSKIIGRHYNKGERTVQNRNVPVRSSSKKSHADVQPTFPRSICEINTFTENIFLKVLQQRLTSKLP